MKTIKVCLMGGTEFGIDENENIFVHNEKNGLHYETNYKGCGIFCYGDVEDITRWIKQFVRGELKEVTVINGIEPFLTLVLFPKGVRAIRREGRGFCYYDGEGKEIIKYYTENCMKLEVDFYVKGAFGGEFWTAYLSPEETQDFISQWLARYDTQK